MIRSFNMPYNESNTRKDIMQYQKTYSSTKFVLKFFAYLGGSAIANQIINKHVQPVTRFQKISIPIATFAIAGIVGHYAAKQIENDMEETLTFYNELKGPNGLPEQHK